jgi:hypothetical protein
MMRGIDARPTTNVTFGGLPPPSRRNVSDMTKLASLEVEVEVLVSSAYR